MTHYDHSIRLITLLLRRLADQNACFAVAGLTAGELFQRFLPEFAEYHTIPNVILDVAKIKGLQNTLDTQGYAYLGPYNTTLQNNTKSPLRTLLCNVTSTKEVDPAVFGHDVYFQVTTGATQFTPYTVTIATSGVSSDVAVSFPTCGGIVHLLESNSLLPCFPNITKHEPLVTTFTDAIYTRNHTLNEQKAKHSGARPASSGLLAVAVGIVSSLLLGTYL